MKKKQFLNFALGTILAVGAVSCSNDDVIDGGGIQPAGNTMTFTIPAKSGVITYSDPNPTGTVTASKAEKAIDPATIRVYMFDATTNLLQAALTPTMSTDNKQATITLDNSWADFNANKHFYLTANTGALSVVAKADLSAGATTLDDFLKLATASQGTTHLMPVEGTASSYLIMTEEVLAVQLATTTTAEAYFRRNVARFDIDNQVNTVGAEIGGNVTVEEVKVYNANLQGFVFGYEKRPTLMDSPAAGDLPKVTVAAGVNVATGKQVQEGMMYLYPTVIAKDGSGTQIVLKGKVGGTSKTFTLKNDAKDISIEANKRYIIKAIDALTLTFTIEVADWDKGEELTGTPDPNAAPFSLLADPKGAAVEAFANNIVTVKDAGGDITFAVKASSSAGTSFTVEAVGSNDHTAKISVAEAPSSAVTYGEPYFASTYTINVGALTPGEGSTTKLTITDKNNPENEMVLRIFHAGDNNEIVTIDDTTFPDEALRDALEEILGSDGGAITSEDLEEVTSIDLSSKTDISSLAGIENFPNLKELDASQITGITGSVDLSSNPKLEVLNINNCSNITAINISNNPNLKILELWRTAITEIDVRHLVHLEKLAIFGTKITSIDVSNNIKLTYLSVRDNQIESINVINNTELLDLHVGNNSKLNFIDISNNKKLTYLSIPNTKISSIDISNNTLLARFECARLGTLDVKVWKGFPTSDPESVFINGYVITYNSVSTVVSYTEVQL